jgi:hypothetical protein
MRENTTEIQRGILPFFFLFLEGEGATLEFELKVRKALYPWSHTSIPCRPNKNGKSKAGTDGSYL